MPVNLDALIRYHTIDKCLQNHYKKWRWEDLASSCFQALDDIRYRSEKNTVSKRTLENDIKILRSNTLGYNAPIICKNGMYSYSDPNYSIKNASLTQSDIKHISFAIQTLKQYKGFSFFDSLKEILDRLEHKVSIQLHENLTRFIHFEDTYSPTGTHFIDDVLDAIQHQQVLKIRYQKFYSDDETENILHPYLLKEFKSRWYVLGFNPRVNLLKTYALDRIKEISHLKNEVYLENKTIDAQDFFSNVIGISNPTDEIQNVEILVKPHFVEYIKTQPFHHTQNIKHEDENGLLINLNVVHNIELETLLCGYASSLAILKPESLKLAIKQRLETALKQFES